jgi:gas vesicle protein
MDFLAQADIANWIKDGTTAGAVIVVVVIFLRFISSERTQSATLSKTYQKRLEDICEENSEATRGLNDTLMGLSIKVEKSSDKSDRLSETINDLADAVKKYPGPGSQDR